MKKILYLGITCLFLTCNLYAKENRVEYSIALVGMSMNYKEYSTSGTLLDSETSDVNQIAGYDMRFALLSPSNRHGYNEFSLGVMMLHGTSDYKGSLLYTGLPYGSYTSTTHDDFVNADLTLKHVERYSQIWSLIFGAGLGYHAWNRELSSAQKELYEWYFVRPM